MIREKALVLVEDYEHPYHGWDRDARGMSEEDRRISEMRPNLTYAFSSVSKEYPAMIHRNFREQTSGNLIFTATYFLGKNSDGFVISIDDRCGNDVLCVRVDDGKYSVNGKEASDFTGDVYTTVRAFVDLDAKRAVVYIGNKLCYDGSAGNSTASGLNLGFDEKGTGKVDISGVFLNVNYYVNEHFLGFTNASDWKTAPKDAAEIVSLPDSNFSIDDIYSLKLHGKRGSFAKATKTFEETCGNVGYEIRFLVESPENSAEFSLSGEGSAFVLKTNDAFVVTENGEKVGSYVVNMWNTLRCELDVSKHTVFIRINGKDMGTFSVDAAAAAFDCFEVGAFADITVDDILIFPITPEPCDYVPEPKPVPAENHYVGMNTCNLWRYGFWRGATSSWQVCSAFDELTPYMGYYDDGNPEVSDWEIKWFSEHAITFQLQCWYGPKKVSTPVKTPGFSQNLHDGFFNAKYKNMSKFAIMWENNFTDEIDSRGFRESFVPFWINYYFKDPSYMTIDNKVVFSIYSFNKFMKYFGSKENAKIELDYLRSEIKKIGFDGMILLFSAGGASANSAIMDYLGAEGSYNYNLGSNSYSPDYQRSVMTANAQNMAESGKTKYVPTVSVGFNAVARHDNRSLSITVEDYLDILTWTRDVLLTNPDNYDQNSYMSKLVLLSCWNEFDEGHYLNPSNLGGFGYLDNLRRVFAPNNKEQHTDHKPTPEQVSRLQVLYPDERTMLRPLRRLPKIPLEEIIKAHEGKKVLAKWDFTKNGTSDGWFGENCEVISTDGTVKMLSDNIDPHYLTVGLDVDISNTDFIRICAKVTPDGKGSKFANSQIFFTTSESNNFTGDKAGAVNMPAGEKAVGYIDMSKRKSWKGTLTGFRFDGLECSGEIELYSIELIEALPKPKRNELYIDSRLVEFDLGIEVEITGNEAYVPFVPMSGIFGLMNSCYTWSRFTKRLDMKVAKHTLSFTVGRDVMISDGKEMKLKGAIGVVDGVPALPMSELCRAVGYRCRIEGDKVFVETK